MAFFDELKKNLSGVTDTVAKTSENVMKKSSTAIEIQKAKLKRVSLEGDMKELYASLGKVYFEICQRKWQSYARRLHLVSMRSMKLSREPLY